MCIICYIIHIQTTAAMRTNIEIDDELMDEALKLTGLPTKRAVVEEGLRLMVQASQAGSGAEDAQGLGLGRRP